MLKKFCVGLAISAINSNRGKIKEKIIFLQNHIFFFLIHITPS